MAGISWSTVGVTWVFCTVTNVVILLVVWGVRRCQRKKHKAAEKRPPFVREMSNVSAVSERSSKISERSTRSHSSMQPMLQTYQAVPGEDSSTNHVNGKIPKTRIHRDLVLNWCSEHGLSEHTAHVLRQNGFTTPEYLKSLRPDVICDLGLRTKAEECRLREVLENKNKTNDTVQTKLEPTGRARNQSASLTESSISTSANDRLDSGVVTSLLSKTSVSSDVDEVDGCYDKPKRNSLPGDGYGHRGEKSLSNTKNAQRRNRRHQHDAADQRNFNGMLSDQGLYDLSCQIGMEWQLMATLVNMPPSIQEQIIMSYPHNAKKQIFEMLRLWRDTSHGSKEEIKGRLSHALKTLGRQDLADELMREAVDGSQEKISTHSIV